jgi:hypothetical protein
MYFDHARCPSCGAQFDPEAIDVSGGVAKCPGCSAQLDVKSLFGVAAHLSEVDAPDASIDDLVAGHGSGDDSWRSPSAQDPMQEQSFRDSYQARKQQKNPPKAHSTSMVRRVRGEDDADPPMAAGPSAVLQALRDIKKDR